MKFRDGDPISMHQQLKDILEYYAGLSPPGTYTGTPILLRETMNYLAVYVPLNEAVTIFKRIMKVIGISLHRVQEELVAKRMPRMFWLSTSKDRLPQPLTKPKFLLFRLMENYVPIILEKSSPDPVRLGKGQKRGRKKEAIVTAVYTIGSNPRTRRM